MVWSFRWREESWEVVSGVAGRRVASVGVPGGLVVLAWWLGSGGLGALLTESVDVTMRLWVPFSMPVIRLCSVSCSAKTAFERLCAISWCGGYKDMMRRRCDDGKLMGNTELSVLFVPRFRKWGC